MAKPVLTNLDGTKSILENTLNAGPVIVDSDLGLSNPDGTGFGGGMLGVQLAGATASDRIGIADTGGITVAGTQVFYLGSPIGTVIQNGVGTTPLQLSLAPGTVSDTAVSALAQAISVSNSSDTPPAGARNLTVAAVDADGTLGLATMKLTIVPEADGPANTAPVAVDDNRSTAVDTPLVFTAAQLVGNDTDANGDALTVTAVSEASHGTVALVAGQIIFMPTAGYRGPASFSYTVSDGHGGADTATVALSVGANKKPVISGLDATKSVLENTVNAGPVIVDSSVSLENADGTGFGGGAFGVQLAGATASDQLGIAETGGITLSGSQVFYQGSLIGTVTQVGIGATPLQVALASGTVSDAAVTALARAITYSSSSDTPLAAARTLTFAAVDADGALTSASMKLTVVAEPVTVNTPPVAGDDTRTATENTPLVFAASGLVGNDTDAENNPLTVTMVSGAVNGTVSLAAGQITFTPSADFTGEASFIYTVSDGQGGTDTATVTVDVESTNAAPTFLDTVSLGNSGAITRISTDVAGTQANRDSTQPVFSSDGTSIAFISPADNLVAGDTNGVEDIFIKDLATGAVIRASTDAAGAQANSFSDSPAFSPDGTKVAFNSDASNLVAGDTNFIEDVFVKDLTSGEVTRVSTGAAGEQADGASYSPIFSPDGSKMAFYSYASNLVPGDTNRYADIFVKDLATGEITRVSTNSLGAQGNEHSREPVFSPDGSKVAFYSSASNLVPGDTNNAVDIFLKDLVTGDVTLVSTATSGQQSDGHSDQPVFSPDGSKVAFWSLASNLVPGDSNGFRQIFVKDLATGELTCISTNAAGELGNYPSESPVFSPDGSKVVFSSLASNLVADDTNGGSDIFMKDLATGEITRLSTDASGVPGNSQSFYPALSSDGTSMAFMSYADNLVPGDTNGAADIFVKQLALASDAEEALTDDPTAETLAAAGTIYFEDADGSDTHTVSADPQAGALGTLTAQVVAVAGAPDEVQWSYEVDRDLVAALGEGETHQDVFTLTLDDGQGETATQEVVITLSGVDDPAFATRSLVPVDGGLIDQTQTSHSAVAATGDPLSAAPAFEDKTSLLDIDDAEAELVLLGNYISEERLIEVAVTLKLIFQENDDIADHFSHISQVNLEAIGINNIADRAVTAIDVATSVFAVFGQATVEEQIASNLGIATSSGIFDI